MGLKKSELVSRVKELEEQFAELKDDNEKLLLFNVHITRLCLQNTASYAMAKTEEQKEISEFFFKFNVHSMVSYFTKVFFVDRGYTPTIEHDKVWLTKWNEHVEKVLNPMYDSELKKIHEKHNPKSEGPGYVS